MKNKNVVLLHDMLKLSVGCTKGKQTTAFQIADLGWATGGPPTTPEVCYLGWSHDRIEEGDLIDLSFLAITMHYLSEGIFFKTYQK